MVGVGVGVVGVGVVGVGCVGRRSVSDPETGPRHVVPLYGICSVLLSTMWAVPLIEKGHDGKPGTDPVPVTVYGTSLPEIWPEAVPDAEMPFAQVAEKVPESEVAVWLVTCQERPVHELAAMFDSGFEDHVPSIDGDDEVDGVAGVAGVPGVVVDDDDVELGANTFEDSRSKPVQAPVTSAPRMKANENRRFMAVALARRPSGRRPCNGELQKRSRPRQIRDPPACGTANFRGDASYLESGCRSPARKSWRASCVLRKARSFHGMEARSTSADSRLSSSICSAPPMAVAA